jgi:hypothetical protein
MGYAIMGYIIIAIIGRGESSTINKSNLVGILLLAVDPFSFYGFRFWNFALVINIYSGLSTIVLLMLLQLW